MGEDNTQIWSIIGVLVGVVLGFGLSVLWEMFKTRSAEKKVKKEIKTELVINKGIIAKKIEIVNELLINVENHQGQRGQSTNLLTIAYKNGFPKIYHKLTKEQLDRLNNIYERIRINEEFLNNFHCYIFDILNNNKIEKPWDLIRGELNDTKKSYQFIKETIDEFLKCQMENDK